MDRPKQKAGFTLIEVLVVVAIIALLVAILLPSLARAREQARGLVCKSNQKQITYGMVLYHTEHKRLPGTQSLFYANGTWPIPEIPNIKQHNPVWDGAIGGYPQYENDPDYLRDVPRRGDIFKYTRDEKLYLCPAQKKGKPQHPDTDPLGLGGNGRSDYSMNAYIGYKSLDSLRRPANPGGWYVRRSATSGDCEIVKSGAVWSPAQMFAIVEEHPYHDSTPNHPNIEGNFNVVDRIVARHSVIPGGKGRTNIAFLDTHVESPIMPLTTDAYRLFYRIKFPSTDGLFIGTRYGSDRAGNASDPTGVFLHRFTQSPF